jgi:pre-mRNA cleavage complex 2 protein Pcf11
MFFDNEDGIYKYKNCREIEVQLDEVALDDSESKFIHVSCWRALGSPDDLTMDQVLQDNVQH